MISVQYQEVFTFVFVPRNYLLYLILERGDDDVYGPLGQVLGPGDHLSPGEPVQPQLRLQRVRVQRQLGQEHLPQELFMKGPKIRN